MKTDRRANIESYIAKNGEVTMKELQNRFKVSMNTIRSDVESLERTGEIVKVYGGVRFLKNVESFDNRLQHGMNNKVEISEKASSLIENGDTIYIDYGTTTMYIPTFIKDREKITIITPNIYVVQSCIDMENINLIVLPGEYNNVVHGMLSDNTVKDLENYHVDKAFMACCGILRNGNVCVARFVQKRIKETIMNNSNKRYLLSESDKFAQESLLYYSSLSDFSALISDSYITNEEKELCKRNNIEVF